MMMEGLRWHEAGNRHYLVYEHSGEVMAEMFVGFNGITSITYMNLPKDRSNAWENRRFVDVDKAKAEVSTLWEMERG